MAVAITTVDNPYDPLNNFSEWFMYDIDNGYNSCGLLDRFAKTSDAMSDAENAKEIERAIDEIIKYDPFNIYRKVKTSS